MLRGSFEMLGGVYRMEEMKWLRAVTSPLGRITSGDSAPSELQWGRQRGGGFLLKLLSEPFMKLPAAVWVSSLFVWWRAGRGFRRGGRCGTFGGALGGATRGLALLFM